MPIQKGWLDPKTGATFPQALFVLSNTKVDTQAQQADLGMAIYVGAAQYSAGRQPLATQDFTITGTAYMLNFDASVRSLAQTYVAGLPQFSGGIVT